MARSKSVENLDQLLRLNALYDNFYIIGAHLEEKEKEAKLKYKLLFQHKNKDAQFENQIAKFIYSFFYKHTVLLKNRSNQELLDVFLGSVSEYQEFFTIKLNSNMDVSLNKLKHKILLLANPDLNDFYFVFQTNQITLNKLEDKIRVIVTPLFYVFRSLFPFSALFMAIFRNFQDFKLQHIKSQLFALQQQDFSEENYDSITSERI